MRFGRESRGLGRARWDSPLSLRCLPAAEVLSRVRERWGCITWLRRGAQPAGEGSRLGHPPSARASVGGYTGHRLDGGHFRRERAPAWATLLPRGHRLGATPGIGWTGGTSGGRGLPPGPPSFRAGIGRTGGRRGGRVYSTTSFTPSMVSRTVRRRSFSWVSIWRMRSRLTPNCSPITCSVSGSSVKRRCSKM